MTSEEAYQQTKEKTDRLVQLYMDWLGSRKGDLWSYKEMPKYAPVDYMIFKNGDFVFYLEVKLRTHEFGNYEEEKVPVTKFTFAYTFNKLFKRKTYLLVGWKDQIGIIDLLNYSKLDEQIARHDRGEEYDLYAFYNDYDFELLKDLYFMSIQDDNPNI